MDRRKFVTQTSRFAFISAMGISLSALHPKVVRKVDADLDKLLRRLLSETKTPAVTLAIVRDGKIAFNKAFGVKNFITKEPVDQQSRFEAASISKTVFAYAVMKLCEKGVMNLDAPLHQYYPELFAEGDSRLKIITARQVLSHKTGLANWRSAPDGLNFAFDPGKGFMYSGEGYYLLQSVVTHLVGKAYSEPCGSYEGDLKVCGTDIADYLTKNIIAPMRMTSSSYLLPQAEKNFATPHDVNQQPIDKQPPNTADLARYAAAGGLLTTATDYLKFLISLFEGKEDDPVRLNKASLSEMFRPQVELPPDQKIDGCTSWGLGWGILERPDGNLIVHSGGQSGFRSLTMASPEKKSGFVMLTNGDNGGQVIYPVAEALAYLW